MLITKRQSQHKEHVVKKAQMKILLIMCYYVISATGLVVSYTVILTTSEKIVSSFQAYFSCQSVGLQPNIDCGLSPELNFRYLTVIPSATPLLLGLLPAIILIFTVKCTCDKRATSKL